MANNQLLASDNFASGSLAAGWANQTGYTNKFKVVAGSPNVAEPQATSESDGQIWTGLTWTADQISEVSVNLTSEASTTLVIFARMQSGANSGYQVNITNGTAALFKQVAGVATQIGSTISGLTFANGDVWTFAVCGSALVLYQNGKQIIRNSDTTYTSGTPGFAGLSTVNSTHIQVLSWRGYSSVQQDGIWKKQGIVIPALASDLSGAVSGVFNNSAVLYEGNAQLLSGNVFKMWFGGGSNIYYAESADGINWTRKSSAVISGYVSPFILKVSGTYYLLAQLSSAFGTGTFEAFTSTDGVTWTDKGSTGLGLGTSGAWDAVAIWYLQPVYIDSGGTWWGLYSAGGTGVYSSTPLKLGVATSANGLTWTKYVGNPVFTLPTGGSVVNSQAIVQINGTWYMWAEGNQPGQQGSVPYLDPTDSVRIKSTDLIHWSVDCLSMHHSELFESVNATTGQGYGNAIVNVNGKAYMYSTSSLGDNSPPQVYQIGLQIAPASIASIITAKEDATQQIATDNFSYGPPSLSANWTTPTGLTALKVVAGNYAEPSVTTGAGCAAAYTGATFSPNQFSEITIHAAVPTFGIVNMIVRGQTGSIGYYQGNIQGAGAAGVAQIYKNVAGVATTIGPSIGCTPQVGDVFRLSAVNGSDGFPVLTLYQNGFILLQVQDYSNAFSTGFPGMLAAETQAGGAQISLWAGGNANVIPSYPSGGSWLQANRDFANKRGIRGN